MTFLNRIQNIFNPEPKEQVIGYSLVQLRWLFKNNEATNSPLFSNVYPYKSSLKSHDVNAFYVTQLIDRQNIGLFLQLVDSIFLHELSLEFNGCAVNQCKSKNGDARLSYLISDEFEGKTIKLVTDSVQFLNAMGDIDFSMPPPWIAFDGFNPLWWSGSMQGAQGYYDDKYFHPFLMNLSQDQIEKYCAKYNATGEWRKKLSMFSDED